MVLSLMDYLLQIFLMAKVIVPYNSKEEVCIITHMIDNQIPWQEDYQISVDEVLSKLRNSFDPFYPIQYQRYKELISCIDAQS